MNNITKWLNEIKHGLDTHEPKHNPELVHYEDTMLRMECTYCPARVRCSAHHTDLTPYPCPYRFVDWALAEIKEGDFDE